MSTWFYVDNQQARQGPVSADALIAAYRQGQVGEDSLVWREGLAQWVPLASCRDELGLNMTLAGAVAPAKKGNGCLIAAAVVVGGGLFLIVALGIVAAIALPAYQDYVGRSKIANIHVESRAVTIAVSEFKANTDRCPRDAAEIGLSEPTTPGVDLLEVGSLDDGRCAVELTLGAMGTNTSAAGGRLLMTLEDDGSWSCSSDGVPVKLLPLNCR